MRFSPAAVPGAAVAILLLTSGGTYTATAAPRTRIATVVQAADDAGRAELAGEPDSLDQKAQ